MTIKRYWNTKKRGIMEFLFYKEGNKYVGVCLTFDIIEESKDIEMLKESIKEAAFLHLKVVQDKRLSDELLNRYAPIEYWKKYFKFLNYLTAKKKEEEKIKQPLPETSNINYPLPIPTNAPALAC